MTRVTRWIVTLVVIALAANAILGTELAVARGASRRLTREADSLRAVTARVESALGVATASRDSVAAWAEAVARRSVAVLPRTAAVTDASRAVLADTSATLTRVRSQLVLQVASTDSLALAFRAYVVSDSAVHRSSAVVESGLRALVDVHKATIANRDDRIRLLNAEARDAAARGRKRAGCAVGGAAAGAALGSRDAQGAAIGGAAGALAGLVLCR